MATEGTSTVERTNNRRYAWELGLGLLAYGVVLVMALTLHDEAASDARNLALMLLPVMPALGIAWACIRMVRRADEYVRSVHLEALAIGFVLAMVAAVTLGFLEIVVPVQGTGWIIYAVGMVGWGVGAGVRSR